MTTFDPRTYWEERLEKSSGLEGVGYLGLGQAFNAWMYRVRSRVFKRVVRSQLNGRPTGKVLDVGSGTGVYLRLWQELQAQQVIGTDITDTAVERLRQQFTGMRIFRMDASEGDPALDGTFDRVSCMDVLFHIVDDQRFRNALANFHRALKPGGQLIISENFLHFKGKDQTHFVVRGLAEYEQALAAAGFRIVLRKPMFHLLNQPTDSRSAWLWQWWALVQRICGKSHAAGGLLAALVYPLELLLVRWRSEGTSTEIMVCERV
jgi:2-polyprenyl-3-methyl-5-hydroxy-6-metoxy-1,4-benzoquinol methylase